MADSEEIFDITIACGNERFIILFDKESIHLVPDALSSWRNNRNLFFPKQAEMSGLYLLDKLHKSGEI